jgi:hypothetical protein
MSLLNCEQCNKEQVFKVTDYDKAKNKLLCKDCNPKQRPRICVVCNKHLVRIGRERANGKGGFSDWKDRKTHAKCYSTYLLMKN